MNMKVKDAKKEIDNIQKTIDILNHINDKLVEDYIISDIRHLFEDAEWKNMKIHIINSMCAYKNILKDRIDNTEM